jgi:hypothetical protein
MPNTSATGGYLVPALSPAPLEDAALDDFFQAVVVGITALPGASVRPRWQIEPPNMPNLASDWAAFGVAVVASETFAWVGHFPAVGLVPGYDEFRRHEELEWITSFYGPDARANAALLKDGLQIAQNREPLLLAGMGVIETGDVRTVPLLVKERWQFRADLPVRIRRAVVRRYPVLDLASAQATLNTEAVVESIVVSQ